jgi:uncharacterized protein YndB with AHSA1/START domain
MIVDGVVIVERHVRAPRADVYRFLTSGDRWATWQGIAASVLPIPGGAIAITMPNGDVAAGHFLELVPDERIVFSWGWMGNPALPPGASTVVLELLDASDGTLIRVTHRDLPTDMTAIHEAGWLRYVPRLAEAATGIAPQPDGATG